MIDDSTTFQEGGIQNRIMEGSENETVLAFLTRGQSTLMMTCVAKQPLRNWRKIFSTYPEIYTLDDEVIMEAELYELKHFYNVLFKSPKGKQLIELKKRRTLMMNFLIIGKTLTSNGKTVFRNIFSRYVNMWKTTLWSAKWKMGWHFITVDKNHSKELSNMTVKPKSSERQHRKMLNSIDQ